MFTREFVINYSFEGRYRNIKNDAHVIEFHGSFGFAFVSLTF